MSRVQQVSAEAQVVLEQCAATAAGWTACTTAC